MPCPLCNNGIMRAIRVDTKYFNEPITFASGEFHHEHDPNPRVGTWVCGNGHEFQLEGLKCCIPCTLERQATIKAQQRIINNSNMQRTSLGNDHHRDSFWSNFGPGPIA